jgi:hypothetical protein
MTNWTQTGNAIFGVFCQPPYFRPTLDSQSPLEKISVNWICCGVASTFFIGIGAVGAALARAILSLITGLFHFLTGLARTLVATVWVLLRGLFGRRD